LQYLMAGDVSSSEETLLRLQGWQQLLKPDPRSSEPIDPKENSVFSSTPVPEFASGGGFPEGRFPGLLGWGYLFEPGWCVPDRRGVGTLLLGECLALGDLIPKGHTVVDAGASVVLADLNLEVGHRAIAYNASKGAVRMLTKSAALHCASLDPQVRVNSVHAGFVETPMVANAVASLPARPGKQREEEQGPGISARAPFLLRTERQTAHR
jgi:NAD(P)-dependent dehydrogenase (short-subunit alcohol dehydrogenase family)